MIKEAGYPRWDKAIFKKAVVSQSMATLAANETKVIIPLVDVSDRFITGALIVNIGAVTSFFVTELNDYRHLSTDKNTYTKAMMWLDYNVFRHSEFKVQDSILFNGVKSVIFKKANSSLSNLQANSNLNEDCYEVEIWYNPNGDANNDDGDEYFTGETYWVGEDCEENEVISVIIGGTGGAADIIPPGYYLLPNTNPFHTPGGSGGSLTPPPPYIPVPLALEEVVTYLGEQLFLTPSQQLWLQDNEIRAREMFSYLYGFYSVARVKILKTHLLYLFEYPEYVTFVVNHRAAFQGNLSMWWENDDWAQANVNQIPNIPFLYVDENTFDPGIDLQKYMNCFSTIPDLGATYEVKLCVDIPVNGQPTWAFNPMDHFSPGHVFLTLTKTNGSQSISQTVGFYPTGGAISPGTFKNDGEPADGHEYNASLTINSLPASGFNTVIQNLLSHQNDQYNLQNNNCANPSIRAFNSVVIPPIVLPTYTTIVPVTLPLQILTMQQSPQRLYQHIENFSASTQITKQVGVKLKAPNSYGSCN